MKDSCIRVFFERIDTLFQELNELAPESDLKNSKIKFETLKEYLSHFDGDVQYFEHMTQKYSSRLRNEINKTYDQILTWRHSYAHAHTNATSLNDAYKAHRYAKYILLAFEDALLGNFERHSKKMIKVFHSNSINAFDAIETNCEIIMEKAENDAKFKKQFEEAWFYLLTAEKFKKISDETVNKIKTCSLAELPNYLNITKTSALECQQASKQCSKIKGLVLA